MESKNKEKSPAFQFYPKDFLSDGYAMAMPLECLGAYIKLLCFDWINDGIENDNQILYRLTGLEYLDLQSGDLDAHAGTIEMLKEKFVKHPTKKGFITNPRLMKEREKQSSFREKQSVNAKKRWESGGSAKPMPKVCSPSSSSSPSSNITNRGRKFVPPTTQEVKDFFQKYNIVWEHDRFFNFYDSKDWFVGKNKMKNWEAAARNWIKTARERNLRHDRPQVVETPTRSQNNAPVAPLREESAPPPPEFKKMISDLAAKKGVS